MPFLDIFSISKSSLENKVRACFANPPTLETQRLILTKIVPEHASDMFSYSCDPDVTMYLTWSCHLNEKQTERYIKMLQKKYASGVFCDFGLIDKQSGKFIGTCGFTSFDYQRETAEIGYVLHRDFWGMGLAEEAARCVMEFGFDSFALSGFCAKCMEGNDASMRVMQKLGMKFEGLYKNSMFIKGSYKTIIIYNVTREDYYKHKQSLTLEKI